MSKHRRELTTAEKVALASAQLRFSAWCAANGVTLEERQRTSVKFKYEQWCRERGLIPWPN